jgi:hypothetical protein
MVFGIASFWAKLAILFGESLESAGVIPSLHRRTMRLFAE